MANWTSLSDLLVSRLGDANHSTLDHLVSRDHQNKIALSITDWRSIAPFLGLEETDEEDIEVMYSTTKTRNIAMLRKWKHLHGSSATYRRLLGAFWDVERIDLIDKLLEMLAADTPPTPTKNKVETKDNETIIYMKTLSGQRIVLEVISTDTVEDLKTMLQHKLPVEERVETKKLRLIFQGQELSDERLLREYGIQNHSTVYQRLQTGTIQLSIYLPDLGEFLPLTVKPATTFTDLVHRVIALERTLLPYQHLLVTLRSHSSIELPADKYASAMVDYDLKSDDIVELTACKKYCHSLQVTLLSQRNYYSLLREPSDCGVITLKLHLRDNFRLVDKLIVPRWKNCPEYNAYFYHNDVMLEGEQLVASFNRCTVDLRPALLPQSSGVRRHNEILEDDIPPVFQVKRKVRNTKITTLRPSGSAVVYINRKTVTIYLPDNNVSIFIIKELMREFSYYCSDEKVQLSQNDLKLTDDTMLSECTSTVIEYKGSTILTYHFISGHTREYSVHYLKQSVEGDTTVCKVKIFSNDTIADLKAAIEESIGIPQQNQALYECDHRIFRARYNVNCNSGHKHKLHDHQIVGDFVRHGRVYLDVRLLVIVDTQTCNTIPFEVLSCDNVLSLKHMITIETDIPAENQTIVTITNRMIVLENTKPVGAYVGDNKLTLDCMVFPFHVIIGPSIYPGFRKLEVRAVPHNNAPKEPNDLLAKSSVRLLITVQFVLLLLLVLCCPVVN